MDEFGVWRFVCVGLVLRELLWLWLRLLLLGTEMSGCVGCDGGWINAE